MSTETQSTESEQASAEHEVTYLIKMLREIEGQLEDLENANLEGVNDEMLAELRERVKRAEDAANDARKDAVEPEMDDRAEPGESLGHLTRVEGHSKYVRDANIAEDALADAGVDPDEAKELKANKVAELAEKAGIDPDALIGQSTYTYWR